MLKKFSDYFPFSILGFVLLIVSLYLLGYGFGSGNLYAILIFLVSFLFIFFITIIGYILKIKLSSILITIETNKKIIARFDNQTIPIVMEYESIPFFYRIHYQMKGKLLAGRDAYFSCFFEASFKPTKEKSNRLEIPIYFPFCGQFEFNGKIFIKDIFGISKIFLKETEENQILVYPPLFSEKSNVQILQAAAVESLRKIKTSDEEKYFMREYIPGDRLKDINWKSSIKINELITKISPLSTEESPLLYIEIRAYHYDNKDGIEAILQLNYLKSWVLSFIKKVQQEHPNYKFQVNTGKEIFLIENEGDFYDFEKKIILLQYMKEPHYYENLYTTEKFVFSTGFDKKISHYLKLSKTKVILFRVVYGDKRKVRLYPIIDFSVLPKFWIFRKENSDIVSPKPPIGKLLEESMKLVYF